MGGTDKLTQRQQENGTKRKPEKQKKKSFTEKLREKLEKLKKEDPNIYPFF